jgi:hypothetical protein
MNSIKITCGILAMTALAGTTMAQDSVSAAGGLPGDALEAGSTAAGFQRSAYVVDLTRMFGSWGTRFGVAPIVKTATYPNGFRDLNNARVFNALPSAQAISKTLLQNQDAPVVNYRLWENLPGGGVHPVNNTGASTVSLSGPSSQFAVALADFGTDAIGRNYNGILGAVVNFDPANPGRLYVVRTQAAINIPNNVTGDTSQFGMGTVDANGVVTFRADNFGSTGAPQITGNNYFRVRTLPYGGFPARNPAVLNQIDNTGGLDAAATDWMLVRNGTIHNTPNAIPSNLSTSGRGAVIGSNFGTNYVFENAVNTTTTTATHRPGTADHRGGVSYTTVRLRGANTVGSAAMITKTFSGNGLPSENLSLWGVTGNGSVVNPVTIPLPRGAGATLNDPCAQLPNVPYAWDLGVGDFRHYAGSIAFRGGNGQVAMTIDQGGNGLLAAEVSGQQSLTLGGLPTDDSPHNAIAVYRFNPATPANGSWIVAAWTNPAGAFSNASGKEIYGDYGNDGAPFTGDPGEFDGNLDLNPLSPTFDAPIGQMTALFEVTGGAPLGPSHSAPAFDSVGNIYFISAVRLKKANGFIDTDSALLRAVYDRQNFCYRLELLIELGDTFQGENSGTRYQVQFLNTAASNSRPSAASIWSGNSASYAWNNTDPATLDSQDPRALGGLVLNASIVYDRDGDGDYDNAVSNPGSLDEQYSALLYVGYLPDDEPDCPADFNGDGFLDFFDYDDYVACFEGFGAPGCDADFNGDGFVDFFDYDDFVLAFETGC